MSHSLKQQHMKYSLKFTEFRLLMNIQLSYQLNKVDNLCSHGHLNDWSTRSMKLSSSYMSAQLVVIVIDIEL